MPAWDYIKPKPQNEWLVARDRETREPRVICEARVEFEGNSAWRKRSKQWYAQGWWANWKPKYEAEKAIKKSPFLVDWEWVKADSAEEAMEQYVKRSQTTT